MGEKIALGTMAASSGTSVVPTSLTVEEKVTILTKQIEDLTIAYHTINSIRMKDKRQQEVYDTVLLQHTNKDSIPIGLSLVGVSVKGGIHILTVNTDGYYIGATRYDSLSAAAEAASGVRRSGWTYWKLPNGQTVKEAFGKV